MIFQYDPLNCYIESDAERNLLFTINRLENVSPRIRYNLHDRGIVRTVASLREVLRDRGLSIDALGPRVDLPLLLHWGRQDSSVAFYGCKITPEDIQHVILRVPQLGAQVANFALHPYEDAGANKRLELWLELAEGVDQSQGDAVALNAAVSTGLALVNQDFRESIQMVPLEHRPILKCFGFGASPISGQDIRIKKQYIL